jgi:N-acetylglucosamine-6-phosphate deacetylase
MDGTKEDIIKAAETHAKFGTTTIFPTAATAHYKDLLLFTQNVKEAMKENAPGKPYIAGSHLEGPYFSMAMRGAQNPDFLKNPTYDEYNAFFEASEGTLKRISFAPELEGAMELNEFLVANGVVSSFGHTDAIYQELKPFIDKGCCLATHLYSGMNTVIRRNMHRKLGAVESSFLEDSVTVEVIADGIHLPPELLKLIYRVKGVDKVCLVTDSMRGAGMGEGPSVLGPKHDGMDCIIKDGIAFLPSMTAFAGSVATTDRLVRVMHHQVGLPLTECIKMMCEVPARVMNLTDRGRIREGYVADLVFFDDDIRVKKVLLQGEELKEA